MDVYQFINQDKVIAQVLAVNKTYQLTWLHLNENDNRFSHFWHTFLHAIRKWDLPRCQEIREATLPEQIPERSFEQAVKVYCEQLLVDIEQKARTQSLVLFVENAAMLTNESIKAFLTQLARMQGLYIAVITKETSFGTVYTNDLPANQLYLSLDEERQLYRDHGLSLAPDQLLQIRDYTDGWRAAVETMIPYLLQDTLWLTEVRQADLANWLETVFFRGYTQTELQRLFHLSLLEGFSLELVSTLVKWAGEELRQFIESSPIIRYDRGSNCYYFAKHVQRYLRERHMLMNNKQKEDFSCWWGIGVIKAVAKERPSVTT